MRSKSFEFQKVIGVYDCHVCDGLGVKKMWGAGVVPCPACGGIKAGGIVTTEVPRHCDEVVAWLREVEARNSGPELSRSDFDALVAKVGELAGALGGVRSTLEMVMSGDLTTPLPQSAINMMAEAHHEINVALRAPGGGGRG